MPPVNAKISNFNILNSLMARVPLIIKSSKLYILLKDYLLSYWVLIFIKFPDFDLKIILKLFFRDKRCKFVWRSKKKTEIFANMLLHHKNKTKTEK